MSYTERHRPSPRQEPAAPGSRTLRLLLCAFLFTAAAVCKNALPAGYREALVTGLDSGPGFREILETFGTPGTIRETFQRLWEEGVLKVFGFEDEQRAVSGELDETAAGSAEQDTAAEMTLSRAAVIPVFSHRAVTIDMGPLPPETETAAALPAAEAPSMVPPGVTLPAYALPEEDADLPVPDAVSREAAVIGLDFVSPVRGRLTSGFGYRSHPIDGAYKFHYGVDLAVPQGTEVLCFADGRVSFTGWGDINGYYLRVDHADGFSTLYAHLSQILVKNGEEVSMGQVLAKSGATGEVSGPHLHFQLYDHDKLIDPAPLLEFEA